MKKFLLTIAAFATFMGMSAQATYNYFDADDVDANGWLWFDTQAKIDKYVGFSGMGTPPKVMLQTATYEDAGGNYPEPEADPTQSGYNAEGVLGGNGAKTGAIILSAASTSNDAPNGGGFMLWLPDCAEFDMCVSGEESMYAGLLGAKDSWVEPVDCGTVQIYMRVFTRKNYFLNAYLGTVNNIQTVSNGITGLSWAASKGNKVTCLFRNNNKFPLYIHGIKVMTYTKSSNSEAGIEDVIDGSALNLSFNGKEVHSAEKAVISVYSVAGSKVAEVNGASVSLENLAPGAYVVKAVSGNGAATIKVVR